MTKVARITLKDLRGDPHQYRNLITKLNGLIDQFNANQLAQTAFDDYLLPATSLDATGANNPAIKVFRGNIEALAFAGAGGMEEAFGAIHLLHGLKQGSSPTLHIHWSHIIGAPSGNVKWQVDYTIARGYGAGTFSAPTTMTSVQAAPAQYVHQISSDDDMVITNSVEVEPDSLLLLRIYRDPVDAEDTFANDAYVFQIDMHYERSHIGTTERNRIWTSTGYE